MAAVTPAPIQSGFALQDGSALDALLASPTVSTEDAITATGSTATTSYQLTAIVSVVGTAGSGTGVALPPNAPAGKVYIVFNNGSNALKIYDNSGATIDGTAGATGVSLTNALRCAYYKTAAAKWLSAQLGVVSA